MHTWYDYKINATNSEKQFIELRNKTIRDTSIPLHELMAKPLDSNVMIFNLIMPQNIYPQGGDGVKGGWGGKEVTETKEKLYSWHLLVYSTVSAQYKVKEES